jgi:hypothetical protein
VALKTILDNLDGIETSLHALYVEKDGKFVLDLEGIDSHPSVIALKNGHANSKRERDEAKRKLADLEKKYGDLPEDFDASEWERLKALAEAAENDPGNKDVQAQIKAAVDAARAAEKKKAEIGEKRLKDEIAALKADNDAKAGHIRRQTVDRELNAALADAGVTSPAFQKAASALLKDHFEVADEDGEFVARVKTDLGGGDVKSYIANWAQSDDGKAFVTPPKGGSEGGSGSKGLSGTNPFSKEAWNKTEQAKLQKTDAGKAERFAKAAGFKDLAAGVSALRPNTK